MSHTVKAALCILTMIFLISSGVIYAQTGRDRIEKAGDRIEITVSKKQLIRDRQELETFSLKAENFKIAYLKGDIEQVDILREELLSDMSREIRQSEHKTRADQKEVDRSSRELKNSNADLDESRRDMGTRNDSRFDDRKDLRDDRRDRQDDLNDLNEDKRDLARQANRLATQIEIRNKFAALSYNGRLTGGEAIVEMKLLEQFVESLESDIEATKKELGEDRRELMEDRRETREDRRENRESRKGKLIPFPQKN